jgi:AraC-like DNA-binding protein
MNFMALMIPSIALRQSRRRRTQKIAQSLGRKDVAAFAQVFRKGVGAAPGAYRKGVTAHRRPISQRIDARDKENKDLSGGEHGCSHLLSCA